MKKLILLAITSMMVSLACAQHLRKDLQAIDSYVEKSRKEWNVPGLAVAIVKDGEVVFAKGYGVRDVRSGVAVDEHTVFAVASNTKSVTAAALAMLVDEGKIDWDDKVQDYLPWFQLYDPYVSANLTIRDLLCHRSGLETFSGDLLWYGSSHTREEVLRKARFLKPAYGFRAHFGYQNIMFLAAGQIIPVVTGMSWEDYVDEKILRPLGMEETLVSTNELNAEVNAATPHNTHGDKNLAIEWVNWDNIAPAGALISSVNDWAKWMMVQMGNGSFNNQELWSQDRTYDMWEMNTPEVVSPGARQLWPTRNFSGYGLGWELETLFGKKVVSHGGGYDGMISRTLMVPEENMGIVVLTNSINSVAYATTYKWLDLYFNAEKETDWSELFLSFKEGREERQEEALKLANETRDKDSSPSLSLEKYAGTYLDEMYGELSVRVIGDQLAFQFVPTPIFRGTLRHWEHDIFQLNWGTDMMLPSGFARFIMATSGEIEELLIEVDNPDFDFTELKFKKVD